ncbi:hypothetical protein [uncultured Roseibium sp.]|uniref:hypothetical protein n=1 Tax=uncultured Roseibium sp. TaxID=1936171 RepID=UPI0032180480
MADYLGEFNEIVRAQNERARQQDIADLNAEIGGYDNGRMKRFLSPEARDAARGNGRSGNKHSSALSALDILLLSDPEYAQLYKATVSENRQAQVAVTDLQDHIARAMKTVETRINQVLDKAVTLPDGRKAFMGKDGKAYTTDMELVDPALAEGIDWTDTPPPETYLSLIEDRERLKELQGESEQHGLRLGEILDCLESRDDPAAKDEVQSLRDEQDDIVDRVKEMAGETHAIATRHEAPTASTEQAPDQPLIATKFDFGS